MGIEEDAKAIAEGAVGAVNTDLLTGTGDGSLFQTGYFREGPLIDRLDDGEQLQYAFENRKRGIEIKWASSTEQVVPGSNYRSAILVTNRRIRCVFGKKQGDRVVEIPYSLIESVSTSSGIRRDKLVLGGEDVTYNLYTQKRSEAKSAASYIRKQVADAHAEANAAQTAEQTGERIGGDTTGVETTGGHTTGSDSIGGDTTENVTDAKSDSSGLESSNDAETAPAEPGSTAETDDQDSTKPVASSGPHKYSTNITESVDGEPEQTASGTSDPTDTAETTTEPSEGMEPRPEPDGEFTFDKIVEPTDGVDEADDAAAEPENSASDAENTAPKADQGDSDGPADDDVEVDESKPTAPPATDPALPRPERVSELDEEAGTFTESAIGRLGDDLEAIDREASVRAHSDLCIALDALPANPADEGVVGSLERAVTELETALEDANDSEPGTSEDPEPTGMTVEFSVHDESDSPIQSATVTCTGNALDVSGETDVDGRYQPTVPNDVDVLNVEVGHHGYDSLDAEIPVKPDQVVDIQLAPLESSEDEASDATDGPSRDDLIVELQALDSDWSQDINRVLLYSVGEYHPDDYADEFGSIETACEAAGLVDGIEPEKAIQGVEPDDLDDSADDASETADALDQAIQDAGLDDPSTTGTDETTADGDDEPTDSDDESSASEKTDSTSHREKLLDELRRLDDDWQKDVDRRLLYSLGNYHPSDYEDEFGSLDSAIAIADDSDRTTHSEADADGEPGEETTSTETVAATRTQDNDIDDDGRTDSDTTTSKSERNAISFGDTDTDDAGPEGTGQSESQHRTELTTDLKRLDIKYAKDVDRQLVSSFGYFRPTEYESEFGSFDEALDAAGLRGDGTDTEESTTGEASNSGGSTPINEEEEAATSASEGTKSSDANNSRYSKDEVLAEIRRLSDELGRRPKVYEMQEHGKISPTPAYRYWNSWLDALRAAGVTADSSTAPAETPGNSPSDGSNADTQTVGSDGLDPNELAELYDIFGTFESVLDETVTAVDAEPESPLTRWYDAVYEYWGGTGRDAADCLGTQQSHRNDFSISDYRDQYGTGHRVREFTEHEVRPVDQQVKGELMTQGVTFDIAKTLVPVAPDSNAKLPVLVETESALEDARALLSEFPKHPNADHVPPAEQPDSGSIPPEGRLDAYTVRVLSQDANPGSHRDHRLNVETEGGDVLRFDIWSKHDIDVDWTDDHEYELAEVRHKVWDSDDEVRRSLSSTRDMTIADATQGGGQDKEEETDTNHESNQDDDDPTGTTEQDDLVETIMKDIDLEGDS